MKNVAMIELATGKILWENPIPGLVRLIQDETYVYAILPGMVERYTKEDGNLGTFVTPSHES